MDDVIILDLVSFGGFGLLISPRRFLLDGLRGDASIQLCPCSNVCYETSVHFSGNFKDAVLIGEFGKRQGIRKSHGRILITR